MDNVLLVFPSSFVNSKERLVRNLTNRLKYKNIKIANISHEEAFIVLDVSDIVEARSNILDMFGVEKVGIAKRIQNRFANVVKNIVTVGKKIVMPKEKFFIKVEISKKKTHVVYLGRDLEFASSGELAVELSDIGARPAINEYEADKIIFSYIGYQYAYVCIRVTPALGGFPFNSQNQKVLCSLHSCVSALSCMISLKCGFVPEIFIPYTSEDDLRQKIKLSVPIINRMDLKKCKIRIALLNISNGFSESIKLMIQESICTKILTLLPGKVLIVPLSAAIYPMWYIQTIMKEIICAGKIPLTPLILSTDNHEKIKAMGLRESSSNNSTVTTSINATIDKNLFDEKQYRKYEKRISNLSNTAIRQIKTISFKIGPNYIHNIIDSI